MDVGPHTTVENGFGVRVGDERLYASIELNAPDHGWSLAWTLPATKSSCGPETKTPGWTHFEGAAVGIEVPPGPVGVELLVVGVDADTVGVDVTEAVVTSEVLVVVFFLCLASALEVKSSARMITRPTTDVAEIILADERWRASNCESLVKQLKYPKRRGDFHDTF